MDSNLICGLLTLAFGFLVVLSVAARSREIALVLLVAFSLRAAVTLMDSFVFTLPGAGDGIGWDVGAYEMSRHGLLGTLPYLGTGHFFYKWLMGVLYALFDRSTLMIKGLNVLVGTLLVKSTWELSMLLGEDAKRGRFVAWMTALSPSLILYSSVLMREVAVSYPLVLSIVYLTRWQKEQKLWLVVTAFLFLVISMVFHSSGFAVLLFGGLWVIGNWFRSILTGRLRNVGRNTLALVLGVGIVIAVLVSGFGLDKFNGLDSSNIDTLTERQENFSRGRAAYLGDLHAESPVDLVWQAPIRIVYFLFAPFPWMLQTFSDAFGVLDSLLFAALIGYALKHRRELTRAPRIMLVIGVFSAMALVFAIGVSNYGTALRHRNKMMPLLIAAVISIPVERRRRQAARSIPLSAFGGRRPQLPHRQNALVPAAPGNQPR